MADLPKTRCVPVVRADFTEDDTWTQLQMEIVSPTAEGFPANIDFVEDRTLAALDRTQIAAAYPRDYPHRYRHPVLLVVDSTAVSSPEHPLLVVNLNGRDASGPFRTLPRHVLSIAINLSLANLDFFEFSRSTDEGGIFRGF